jgi:hypothetical protein
MLNQLTNLTNGLFASGGQSDSVAPFDRNECLGVLLDMDDDITIALDMLHVLNEQQDAPVVVNYKWSIQVLDYACLLMGLRELVRNVQISLPPEYAPTLTPVNPQKGFAGDAGKGFTISSRVNFEGFNHA